MLEVKECEPVFVYYSPELGSTCYERKGKVIIISDEFETLFEPVTSKFNNFPADVITDNEYGPKIKVYRYHRASDYFRELSYRVTYIRESEDRLSKAFKEGSITGDDYRAARAQLAANV